MLSNDFETQATDNPLMVPSLVTSFKPDWILLDVEMPTIDGHDVLNAIRNTNMVPMNRIIMFSTSARAEGLASQFGLAGAVGKDIEAARRLMLGK